MINAIFFIVYSGIEEYNYLYNLERCICMERFAMNELEQWKRKQYRKPLVIEGAYRVGKTWLMKEFGKKEYEDYIYIDFGIDDYEIEKLFTMDLDVEQLVCGLEAYAGNEINSSNTLIIFDNIHIMPSIMKYLESFYKCKSDYHIICASSYFYSASHAQEALYLASKVEIIKLYPMSFMEFFQVTGEERFVRFLFTNNLGMMTAFKQVYIDALKNYCFVGGMPEAVLSFSQHGELNQVRDVQKNILNAYEKYFKQYVPPALYSKVCLIWENISHQLEKKNKQFFYGAIQKGGRAKEYEAAIMWLSNHGFIHKVNRVTIPTLPLKNHESLKGFKLFMVDVGLLGYMFGLCEEILSEGNKIFINYKGALTEQYAVQQLISIRDWNIHYYANERCACEINCLIDNDRIAIPIDVRVEINSKTKRLLTYQKKFQPEKLVQITMEPYYMEEHLLNLPLYAVGQIILGLDM